MNRIKFEYPSGSPTTTVELTWGVQMSAPSWRVKTGSIVKRAYDGTIHSASKGVSERLIPLTLNFLTESERDSLIDFIETVGGRFRSFRFTNHDGEAQDVRFLDEEFDFGDGTVPYSLQVTLIRV